MVLPKLKFQPSYVVPLHCHWFCFCTRYGHFIFSCYITIIFKWNDLLSGSIRQSKHVVTGIHISRRRICQKCTEKLFHMSPTRCALLLSIFISTSVHVSGNYMPIIRRTFCIYATLVFFVLYGWLSGLPADQTATHTQWKIPVSHRYSKFYWWWAHSCPKHVQKLK